MLGQSHGFCSVAHNLFDHTLFESTVIFWGGGGGNFTMVVYLGGQFNGV